MEKQEYSQTVGGKGKMVEQFCQFGSFLKCWTQIYLVIQ